MRFLSLILDVLVITFFVAAFYRLGAQKGDAQINEDREKLDRKEELFDNLNDSFDEGEDSAVAAPAVK